MLFIIQISNLLRKCELAVLLQENMELCVHRHARGNDFELLLCVYLACHYRINVTRVTLCLSVSENR